MAIRSACGLLLAILLAIAAAADSKPSTLFDPGSVPAVVDTGPDAAVEVGVKFRSEVNGTISAIRFYKSSANTGPHVVRLWSSSGALLASATSTNESSSGWQQVELPAPVKIAAAAVYVASYHADAGHYSFSPHYFAQAGLDRPPLHAPASREAGGNGVYAYGPSNVFPSASNDGGNYWVDVVFTPRDLTLVAISVKPASASILAGTSNRFTATGQYSDGSTEDLAGLAVWESHNLGVATVSKFGSAMGVSGGEATITARVESIVGGATVSVRAGPSEDREPLLVVTSGNNLFTAYLPEILRGEGLNEFDVLDIAQIAGTVLSGYDLVLLGDMALTPSQVTMISDWVKSGGNLIAMHPDKQLASLLGLAAAGGILAEAYLQINTTTGPGTGLVAGPIQYHSPADRYLLIGAHSLATLYSSLTAVTNHPAVTLNVAGRGQAAAFAYDLARSVVYTRQGNPAWGGQARDRSTPIRTYDLFFGSSRTDPQPDWVDFANIAIPQADEQQRLLANLILQMIAVQKPLPRFWYLPRGFKAAVVMTGDDHGTMYATGNGATAIRFRDYLLASPPACKVENWECVRASAYLFPPAVAANPLRPDQAVDAVSRGFEIAVHVDSFPDCSDWSPASLDASYTGQLSSFASRYTGVPAAQTGRMHCVPWSDYDTQPQVEFQHGIRMDANYYYYPQAWINNRPGLFTGSGMPQRFAARNGAVLDVYQLVTQMTDESGQSYPLTIDTLLDNAVGPLGYYGVFTANMHTDSADSTIARSIVASARKHGVPVVSALQMLQWLDGRNGSFFSAVSWKGNALTFKVSVAPGANGLSVLLPANGPSGRLAEISCNGKAVSYTPLVVKGIEYGIFSAGSGGSFQALYTAARHN